MLKTHTFISECFVRCINEVTGDGDSVIIASMHAPVLLMLQTELKVDICRLIMLTGYAFDTFSTDF